MLLHPTTCCNTLQHRATHYLSLHRATRLHTLQRHVSCWILQHTATCCNTVQHTATCCNTVQHTAKRGVVLNAGYVSNTSVSLMSPTMPISRSGIGSGSQIASDRRSGNSPTLIARSISVLQWCCSSGAVRDLAISIWYGVATINRLLKL